MNKCCSVLSLLAVLVVLSAASREDVVRTAEPGESLGPQLLDDLDPHQFAPPTAAPTPAASQPRAPKRILPGVTDDTPDNILGTPPSGGPLLAVKQNMQTARSLLRGPETLDQATPVQRQVVADLDALIDQLAKQCNCSGSKPASGQPKSGSQRSQTASSRPASGRGTSPASDSTARIQRGDSQTVNPANREDLLKNLWGHLPPHVREQMLQAHSDEFLPQYESEIEAYFRQLAEEDEQEARK